VLLKPAIASNASAGTGACLVRIETSVISIVSDQMSGVSTATKQFAEQDYLQKDHFEKTCSDSPFMNILALLYCRLVETSF